MAIDGNWEITVNSPMGAQKSQLVLKTAGGALTGTAAGAAGTVELQNGKADGNNVSWSSDITQPFPMTLDFSGAVDGDAISGDVKAGNFGSFPFTGNRV